MCVVCVCVCPLEWCIAYFARCVVLFVWQELCTVHVCCCYVFAVCSLRLYTLLWHRTSKEDSSGMMVAPHHVLETSQIVVGFPAASPVSSPEASPRSGCSVSQQVPKAKTTGSHIRDMQLEFERSSFIECIAILWDKPSARAECLAFLQVSKTQKEQDDMGPDYFKEVTTLAKLCENKEWVVAYVCQKTGARDNDLGQA